MQECFSYRNVSGESWFVFFFYISNFSIQLEGSGNKIKQVHLHKKPM